MFENIELSYQEELMFGWLIGQLGAMFVTAYYMQLKNDKQTLTQAIHDIVVKKSASWILGVVMLFGGLFILPETLTKLFDAHSAGVEMPYYQKFIVNYFRISSIAFGASCQLIGIFALSKLMNLIKVIFSVNDK